MNNNGDKPLIFSAHYIGLIEINHEIASSCQLRSKFVHEKFFEYRNKHSVCPIALQIYQSGLRIVKEIDQTVLSSHTIQRVSYSACDRTNRLFALVVRSTELDKHQLCYMFRMESSEQSDSVNRYFGTIFKQLQQMKKEKKPETNLNNAETTPNVSNELATGTAPSEDKCTDNRLRQISRSNIDELVDAKHSIRRLSLYIPNTESIDIDIYDRNEPLHSSLEKKSSAANNDNFQRSIIRRKKSDFKLNRISAAIERMSFRIPKELSGSPVVALKEQLEYEELLSAQCKMSPNHMHNGTSTPLIGARCNIVRKNSAPSCNPSEDGDQTAPVPPIRINSLRTTHIPKTSQLVTSGTESAPHSRTESFNLQRSITSQLPSDPLSLRSLKNSALSHSSH